MTAWLVVHMVVWTQSMSPEELNSPPHKSLLAVVVFFCWFDSAFDSDVCPQSLLFPHSVVFFVNKCVTTLTTNHTCVDYIEY